MVSVEQRINIKFCVPLEKSATETFEMLKHVYRSETLSRMQAFECRRRFREGRESAEDDECCRHPVISRTNENIKKVSAAVCANRQQTIYQIAESVGISEATCQRIQTKDLNMHKVCQHIVPRMLNVDQKVSQLEMAGESRLLTKILLYSAELLLETRNAVFYTIRRPREHRHCGNHHNLHRSRNSSKIALKERLC
ncbi:hypothetical protein X975_10689, partial [Stegodyphus mimosarum]